jgi:hypothetical protein
MILAMSNSNPEVKSANAQLNTPISIEIMTNQSVDAPSDGFSL